MCAYTYGANPFVLYTNGVERLRVDSAGNLGLGVTPSAWQSGRRAFQIQGATGGGAAIHTAAPAQAIIAANNFNDGTNLKYIATAAASQYEQLNGAHSWSTAPSGTAGNTITFTQAMTLDADGDLGVGTTSPTTVSNYRAITVNGTNGGILDLKYGDTLGGRVVASSGGLSLETGGATALTFFTNGSERARINSTGDFSVAKTGNDPDVGVGSILSSGGFIASTRAGDTAGTQSYLLYSTGASAYRFYVNMAGTIFATNTSISAISDARLKENIRDLDVGLDAVMALKPRKFDWKKGKGANIKDARGFIAQEFEQVFPDLVSEWLDPAPEGEEPYKSVRQDLIPVLVKAIQELKAELDVTKAEVAALKGAN
jgi:hypothetical protein